MRSASARIDWGQASGCGFRTQPHRSTQARPTVEALLNDRAPNDLLKALLFWAAYSQFPGCGSVKWGLMEEVVMATSLR